MADAEAVLIAEAVKDLLAAATLSQEIEAERKWLPRKKLSEMEDAIYVTVVPRSQTSEILGRAETAHVYYVDVAVQNRPENLTNAKLDPLAYLVDEIRTLLLGQRLASPTARCIAAKIPGEAEGAIAWPDHLDELRQFTSIMTLTYKLVTI